MLLPKHVKLAELAYLAFQMEDELERQSRIVRARDLYEGTIDQSLVDSMTEVILGDIPPDFTAFNLARRVVNDVRDRLKVTGFDISDPDQANALWMWWSQNKMDTLQHQVHTMMLRDGEAFIIVDYDMDVVTVMADGSERFGRPRFWPHQRFTSPEVDGDGEGCYVHYPDGNINMTPLYASKRWTETIYKPNGEPETRMRMTIYVAGDKNKAARIERYMAEENLGGNVTWIPYREDGQPFPIWWTDNGLENGRSLPIPVIHFRNEGLRSRTHGVGGAQLGMDQTLVALITAASFHGFPVMTLSGGYATTDGEPPAQDGSNWMKVSPHNILGSPDMNAKFGRLQPGDLSQLMELVDQWPLWVAMYTNTPGLASTIIARRQISGETLKQFEAAQTAEVERLQDSTGDSWEQVMQLGWLLELAIGRFEGRPNLDLTTRWESAEKRVKHEENEEMRLKKDLDVPKKQLWAELGYSPDKIDEMLGDGVQSTLQEDLFGNVSGPLDP